MEKPVYKVILTDDHQLVRSGLRLHLESRGDIRVIGEAGNGEELLRLLAGGECDLVLIDLAMPGMNGLETLPRLRELHPGLACIVLSAYPDYAREAKRLGASGYLLKSEPAERVAEAVRTVLKKGRRVFSDGLPFTETAEDSLNMSEAPEVAPGVLSRRELQVLRLLAQGYKHAEIAAELSVVERTVEFHKQNIKAKLKLPTTAQLVRYAVRRELV